ncbi:MAG: fimbrillin family protein [Bacteroidaceae bacterium]|nr:fimbrillin family protein [Bacteroidaceae bacterium]
MNIKSLSTLALGMLLLASCASDDVTTTALNETSEYVPGNSEYPVRLHGSTAVSATTRAAVEGNETDPRAVLDRMGIFSLARDKQGVNESAGDIQWWNNTHNWSDCLMDNVLARMENGDITWEGIYFYPITQFYSYDFYGYYPYTEDLTRTNNSVTAHYTIDGTNDLIWGRATSDEDYAYSAKYYRTYGTSAVDPTLDLKHLLTRLVFTAEPGESYVGSGDYTEAENMQVKSIKLCDVYTNLDVLIAEFDNAENSNPDYARRLTLRDEVTDTLSLCDETGEPFALTQVPAHTEDPLQIGESIMLYPANQYVVRVALIDANGEEHVSEIPLMLSTAGGFLRGNSYTVRVIVHGPRAIEVKGNLTPWNDVDGPILEL